MNIFINDAKSTSGSILDETKLDYVSLKLYVFGRKMKLELSTSKSRYSEISRCYIQCRAAIVSDIESRAATCLRIFHARDARAESK